MFERGTAESPLTAGLVGPQDAIPSIEDRDKVWARTTAGKPSNPFLWKFYNGAWVAPHPVPADPDFIAMFAGLETAIETKDGGTAGTATINTGPFWTKVTELNGRFPVGPGVLQPSGTPLLLAGTGGEDQHTLTIPELAAHVHRLTSHGTSDPSNGNGFMGGANNSTGPFTYDDTAISSSNHASIEKLGSDAPHNNLPPYWSVWFIRRTLRQLCTTPIS